MPLAQGSSRQVIGHNIALEIRSGKKPRQAAAIAYHEAEDDAPLIGENPIHESVRFYTPVRLSTHIAETPEGFLICRDVPIARVGELLYLAKEINLEPGRDGFVRVTRTADDLFDPEAMASFEGKPVTFDHPPEDVTPENWKQYAVGVIQNVHRGTGAEDGLLLADLLIMDKSAISAVRFGRRDISLGYDARYKQSSAGFGIQKDFRGNHAAIVARGRCGPKCSIRDRRPKMAHKSLIQRIRDAFAEGSEEKLEEAMRDMGGDAGSDAGEPFQIHIHNGDKPVEKNVEDEVEAPAANGIEERLARLEALVEKLAAGEAEEPWHEDDESPVEEPVAEETAEEQPLIEEEKKPEEAPAEKTHDSASVYQDFVSRAELIAPGVKMPRPTKDAFADPKKTRDAMTICKRRALSAALKNEKTRDSVARFLTVRDGQSVDQLSPERVDAAFVGSSELVRSMNNLKQEPARGKTQDKQTVDAFSRDGLNQIHKDFWKRNSAGEI